MLLQVYEEADSHTINGKPFRTVLLFDQPTTHCTESMTFLCTDMQIWANSAKKGLVSCNQIPGRDQFHSLFYLVTNLASVLGSLVLNL